MCTLSDWITRGHAGTELSIKMTNWIHLRASVIQIVVLELNFERCFLTMASKALNLRFAYLIMCRRLVSPRNEVIKYCDGEKHCSVVADPESGEIICVGCGAVTADRMIQSSLSWSINHHDARRVMWDRVNVSFSLNLSFTSQFTVIGKENRDASGRRLDPRLHEKLSNFRRWDHILQSD